MFRDADYSRERALRLRASRRACRPSLHHRCGRLGPSSSAMSARRPVRSLPFAEADNFIIGNFKQAVKNGIKIGGQTYPVEVVVKDSQSNPNRAAEVAKDLIVHDKMSISCSSPRRRRPPIRFRPNARSRRFRASPRSRRGSRGSSAGRPIRPADRRHGSLQLHLSLLLGARRRHRRIHQHVEPARDQQIGRRPVSQ